MSKGKERVLIFSIGCFGYGFLEILWRGYTHWSMLLTGGSCFSSLYRLHSRLKSRCLLKKCFLFSWIITGYEFLAGCLFNKIFHLNVWDYSNQPGNLWGQICPLYTFLWFLLAFPLVFICSTLTTGIAKLRRRIET